MQSSRGVTQSFRGVTQSFRGVMQSGRGLMQSSGAEMQSGQVVARGRVLKGFWHWHAVTSAWEFMTDKLYWQYV